MMFPTFDPIVSRVPKMLRKQFPVNMGAKDVIVSLPSQNSAKIVKWKVEEGTIVYEGRVLLLYDLKSNNGTAELKKLKATEVGTVRKLLAKEGELVDGGAPLLELERGCSHPTVMNDLCAECGADLRRESVINAHASVPMVHSVPDLKVSEEVG
ncbi:RNA polymerase II [Homalodisca vitripennis]|nr:RNA polymerase II [Homalodisca vitripennis]